MNNKKIGVSLLVLSVILLIIFVVIIRVLNQEIEALGCFERPGCQTIETSLTIVHFAFGVFGFLFALSFYLFFFSKGDEAIVQRLENDSLRNLEKKGLIKREKERKTFAVYLREKL